jgi:hypothetical protein
MIVRWTCNDPRWNTFFEDTFRVEKYPKFTTKQRVVNRGGERFSHKKARTAFGNGVGTVNRHSTPILPVKIQFVRLGPANRVVIFDEITHTMPTRASSHIQLLRWLWRTVRRWFFCSDIAILDPAKTGSLVVLLCRNQKQNIRVYPFSEPVMRGLQMHFEQTHTPTNFTITMAPSRPSGFAYRNRRASFCRGMGLALVKTVQRAQDLNCFSKWTTAGEGRQRIGKRF